MRHPDRHFSLGRASELLTEVETALAASRSTLRRFEQALRLSELERLVQHAHEALRRTDPIRTVEELDELVTLAERLASAAAHAQRVFMDEVLLVTCDGHPLVAFMAAGRLSSALAAQRRCRLLTEDGRRAALTRWIHQDRRRTDVADHGATDHGATDRVATDRVATDHDLTDHGAADPRLERLVAEQVDTLLAGPATLLELPDELPDHLEAFRLPAASLSSPRPSSTSLGAVPVGLDAAVAPRSLGVAALESRDPRLLETVVVLHRGGPLEETVAIARALQ